MADVPLPATGQLNHPKAWRLALVAGDEVAMRVLAAWYSLPRRSRARDLERLADLANVPRVHAVLARLRAAGVIVDQDNPPPIAEALLTSFIKPRLTPGR